MSALCRRFGISRKTGYKWLRRFEAEGSAGLTDQSRRPRASPNKTPSRVEAAVCAVRRAHPAWSGYKIRHVLLRRVREGRCELGAEEIPAASTCTNILDRHGLIEPREPQQDHGWQRFEKDRPNELWQIDFKGNFELENGVRVWPLTVLDDHSRFSVALRACGDHGLPTVQEHLTDAFRRYGLPDRILADNGPPWGAPRTASERKTRYTRFTVWLYRIGVSVSFSRPFHPQTLGKDERFHRTLDDELLRRARFRSLPDLQAGFDAWRTIYNLERPHEALDMSVPADRYRSSPRPFPERLPPIEYDSTDAVRKVRNTGQIRFGGHSYDVGTAFRGFHVALRPSATNGLLDVYFCTEKVTQIDLSRGVD